MDRNKRQDLYFASVVFLLLTVYFFFDGVEYYNDANEIEENCSDWQGCSTLEREVIEEMNQNATKGIIISVIMGSLAIFFWPENNQREW